MVLGDPLVFSRRPSYMCDNFSPMPAPPNDTCLIFIKSFFFPSNFFGPMTHLYEHLVNSPTSGIMRYVYKNKKYDAGCSDEKEHQNSEVFIPE